MKHKITYILVIASVLGIVCAACYVPEEQVAQAPKEAPAPPVVLDCQVFEDSLGGVAIVGHVKNESELTYSWVTVGVKLYNKQGVLIDNRGDGICDLAPGEVWEFHTGSFLDFEKLGRYEVYIKDFGCSEEEQVTQAPTKAPAPPVVLDCQVFEDSLGGVAIVGHVKNESELTYSWVTVGVKLYNKQGVLIDNRGDGICDLAPGEVWEFHTGSFLDFEKLDRYEVYIKDFGCNEID